MAYGKSYSNNYLEQRRVNNYDASTYMCVKADFEPIISEEVWNRCQEIKKARVATSFSQRTITGKEKLHGKMEPKDIWVKKLRCSCGASFRKNRWHKNKGCDWSYGYQCYNQLNNGSARKRREAGEDDTGYCDQRMIADWKLELMGKAVFEEIWKNKKDCIIETVELIKRCYKENKINHSPKTNILTQIEKLKQKKSILLEMRTNGELTKEEFIEQKNIVNQKISDLEKQISNTVENDTENILIDYDKIIETLNDVMDFSKPKVDKDIIDKFVYKIVPMGNNHFCWYMNLDGKNSSTLNINIEGSKKQAVISIDEEGTSSPIHNINSNDTLIVYINDKKSFTSAILHRLQSQKWTLNLNRTN